MIQIKDEDWQRLKQIEQLANLTQLSSERRLKIHKLVCEVLANINELMQPPKEYNGKL